MVQMAFCDLPHTFHKQVTNEMFSVTKSHFQELLVISHCYTSYRDKAQSVLGMSAIVDPYVDKREVLQLKIFQPPILPSPHFLVSTKTTILYHS